MLNIKLVMVLLGEAGGRAGTTASADASLVSLFVLCKCFLSCPTSCYL